MIQQRQFANEMNTSALCIVNSDICTSGTTFIMLYVCFHLVNIFGKSLAKYESI